MKTLVVNCGSKAVVRIEAIFSAWSDVATIAVADIGDSLNADADLIVISGGPRFYQDDDTLRQDYLNQFRFLDREIRPTFGICMGHQGIGLQHGSRIFTGQLRRVDEAIHLSDSGRSHPLLAGIDSPTLFAERHTEGITLPSGFELLGYSRYYPVEIMAAQNRPFFSTQFHPEISGPQGERLLRNFFDLAKSHIESSKG